MFSITLQTSDSSISVNDVLGRLGFAASSESDGADSILVAAIIEAVSEGNFTQTSNATSLVFSTANSATATEKMRINSDGYVGINTSSPSSKLEIVGEGSTTDDGIITVNDPSSGGTTSWIKLYADDGYDDLTWHISYADTSMFRDLEFRSSFSSVREVSISESGTLNVEANGTSTKRFKAYDFYSTTYNTAALPAYTFANDLDTGMWLASANNLCWSTAGVERMRIDSIGNVGIGTSTTTRKLTVQGNTSDNSAAVLIQADGLGSTTTDGLLLSQNNAGLGYLWNFENKGLVFGTNNNERMRIDENGSVGINTTNPLLNLHVVHPDGANGFVITDSAENGLVFGEGVYSASAAYTGMSHTAFTGSSDYMIMSAGSHTLVSAKSGYDTFIRGGGNSTTYQARVGSNFTIGADLLVVDTEGLKAKKNIYIDRYLESNIAVGWYTVAVNAASRACGRFGLACQSSNRHQGIIFYASHYYGSGNQISILHNEKYSSSNPIAKIRIKEGGTYDGCLLQVYIDATNSNTPEIFLLGDNINDTGWVVTDWVADGTDPGTVSNFSSLTNVAVEVDLDTVEFGTTGNSEFQGSITGNTSAVFNESGGNNDFRVEGDTDTDLLFVDASTDRVGVSTNTPAQVFDITTYETEGLGVNFPQETAPSSVGGFQSLITESRSSSIITKHLENTSNGSSTLVLKNLIRYGTDFVSIDGAYTTGLSTNFDPKLFVNTDSGNVGIGTVTPTEVLDVSGGLKSTGWITYSDSGTGTSTNGGVGVASGFNVKLSDTHGTTLRDTWHYIIRLTTTGTGVDTGSSYLVWYSQPTSTWIARLIGRSGSTSNHPLLGISGSNAVAYDEHSGNYGIQYTVESYYTADSDGTPHSMGANFQWQRDVDTLSYSDGDVVVDGARPVTISASSNIATSKKASAGGWEFSHDAIGSAGTNSGGYGWYGTNDVLSRYWIGPAYDTASFNILYSNGNVGINILNPAYDLDLAGTARIEPTSHGMLIGRGSGASSIRATGATTPSEYLILDSNGQYMSLNHYTSDNIVMAYGGGNVGMGGNYSPANKLHIYEDSTYSSENTYAIKISDGGSPETHGMLLGVDSANNIASIQAVDPGTSWARNLSLQAMGGNLGIATISPTEKLHIVGGNILSSSSAGVGGGIGKADDGVHILYPGGGTFGGTSSSTATGYIKIKLPAQSSATMLAFDLDIYEYESNVLGRVAKFRIAGYEYSNDQWHRTQVIMDGDGPSDHKYKVSFGEDTSGNKSIYISQYSDGKNGTDQTDSSLWRYPKVSVSNVFCGHASVPYSEWIDGWDIGIVTASDIDTVYANHVVSRSLKLYESSYDLASLTINSAFTFPTADGSNGQTLTTDGAGNLSFSSSAGGISNLVEDTTPQLGGNLDLNSKNISGTGNIGCVGILSSTSATIGAMSGYGLDITRTGSTFGNTVITDLFGNITFTGQTTYLEMSNTALGGQGIVTMNPTGGNQDFRVEGDSDTNLIYADASTDRVGIGTDSPTQKLDIDSDSVRLRDDKTPASANAAGDKGEIAWDSDYVYVCVATNTWKRSSLSTW